MKHILILFFIFIIPIFALAQKIEIPKEPTTREVVLNQSDTIYRVQIFIENPKVKINKSKFYSWFYKETLLHTEGSWSGKLLQGKYEVYYPNNNLFIQGKYKKGWKVGIWKKWYPDGTLMEQKSWKKGLVHGNFTQHTPKGNLSMRGKYLKGQMHGFIYIYDEEGNEKKLRYKKGTLILKRKKVSRVKKRSKSPKKTTKK